MKTHKKIVEKYYHSNNQVAPRKLTSPWSLFVSSSKETSATSSFKLLRSCPSLSTLNAPFAFTKTLT